MMALLRRSKQTVGLDIGSGSIKAALVDHSGLEPRLVGLAGLPLLPDAIVEGEIMDPPLVVDTIQAVLQTLGVRRKSVVTAVGGRDLIVKKIRMDRMSRADAGEVIRWEAERYVPFDMENVGLDFQILDPEQDGLQMDVLLVAAKRELIDQRVALLADARVEATVVDVDGFALFNAFEYNYPTATRGVSALVNVGHEISTVIVQQHGVPTVLRDVLFGSRPIHEELQRLYGSSAEEAAVMVQGDTPLPDGAERVLYERGAELAMAIERATAFLGSEAGAGLSAVHLSGGSANMPRLKDAIADRLRTRIDVATPLQRLEAEPEAVAGLKSEHTAPMWMLPVGLALRAPV